MNNVVVSGLQLVVALGLLNVWLVRAKRPTEYRGGNATSIVEEFQAYGLPVWFCYLIGALKITSALLLLVGFVRPELVSPVAAIVALLMIGALAMHVKVGDPIKKSVPAGLMLAMSLAIYVLS